MPLKSSRLFIGSVALYILSFLLPVTKGLFGIGAYLAGVMSLGYDWDAKVYFIFWCANLLYYKSIYDYRRQRPEPVIITIAVLLASAFPIYHDYLFGLVSIRIGYYVWLASFVAQLVAVMIMDRKQLKAL